MGNNSSARTEEAVTDPIEFERDGKTIRFCIVERRNDGEWNAGWAHGAHATPADFAAAGYVHSDALEAAESERDVLQALLQGKDKLPGGYGPDYVTRKELVEALNTGGNEALKWLARELAGLERKP